ncbi:MAG: hypothetical protein GX800_04865, partial [Clostridiaceae bacterium]|nr:hypothetical protein [Clostridiaceae bacterium]
MLEQATIRERIKSINVTFNEYGIIENISDENLTLEQEECISIYPLFPEVYHTTTKAITLTEGSDEVEFTASDDAFVGYGSTISGDGIPDGTTFEDWLIPIPPNTDTKFKMSNEATKSGLKIATFVNTFVSPNYELRIYLQAQNKSSGFFDVGVASKFTIPVEFMVEGDLRIGFEIKDGDKYIRFEPFKITIKDFVRLTQGVGKVDYT